MKSKTICFWSGGKDAALALFEDRLNRPEESYILLTSVSAETDRALMQGIRKEVIRLQALALNLDLVEVEIPAAQTMDAYNTAMTQAILNLKSKGYQRIISGDIFLQDLRDYRVKEAAKWGVSIDFPIFGRSSQQVIERMRTLNFWAPIVALNLSLLQEEYLGKDAVTTELPSGIDICGENGEFHTLVLKHPLFEHPISVDKGAHIVKNYTHDGRQTAYAFLDYKVKL